MGFGWQQGTAGVLTISQLCLTVLLLCACVRPCVCLCVSEVVKHALREGGGGTCSKCMLISVEEVMESGHFYGLKTSHLSLYNERTC